MKQKLANQNLRFVDFCVPFCDALIVLYLNMHQINVCYNKVSHYILLENKFTSSQVMPVLNNSLCFRHIKPTCFYLLVHFFWVL